MRHIPAVLACLLFLATFPSPARAQGGWAIPEGFEKLFETGKLRVLTRNARTFDPVRKAAIEKELKSWYSSCSKQFSLTQEVRRIGRNGGLFERTPRESVVVLLFDQPEEYVAWQKENSPSAGSHPADRYVDLHAACLGPEGLSPEEWRTLRGHLSRSLFRHRLYLGEPAWLCEGFARYTELLWGVKDALDVAALEPALKELREPTGEDARQHFENLLMMQGTGYDARRCAEAMVLVHFLVHYAPDLLRRVVESLVTLESAAWENPEGVGADIRRYAAHLLIAAFGSQARLQKVWEDYARALLDGGEKISRPSPAPKFPTLTRPDGEMNLWIPKRPELAQDGDKTVSRNFPSGKFRPPFPWGSAVTLTGDYGEGNGKWTDPRILATATSLASDQTIEFKDIRAFPSPVLGGHILLRITAEWKSTSGGGVFRSVHTIGVR